MIICDVDNTVADCSHRATRAFGVPHIGTDGHTNEEWDKFFEPKMMLEDPVIPFSKECLSFLSESHDIYMCTARLEKRREVTEEWLSNNGIKYKRVLMRNNLDKSNSDIKALMASSLVEHYKHERVIAFDDEYDCLDMYRIMGFEVMKAPVCWEPLYSRIINNEL